MPQAPRWIWPYLIAVTLAAVTRGLFIVGLAWSAFDIGGSLAAVGIAFITGHLVTIFLGPGVGTLIDRSDRRRLALISLSLFAVALLLPAALTLAGRTMGLWVLLAMAAMVSVSGLTLTSALDATQKALAQPAQIARVNAIAGGLRQGAMVMGAGLGGVAIALAGAAGAFLCGAAFVLAAMLCVLALPVTRPPAAPRPGFLRQLAEGLREMQAMPDLWALALLGALAMSVGQLSNVLLPAFVRDDLGGDAAVFGWIDALWSVGGILSAAATAHVLGRRRGHGAPAAAALAAAVLGALTAAVAAAPGTIVVAGLYLAMGAAFSLTRVLCDGRMIALCPEDRIGRIRAQSQSLNSAMGLLVYGLPFLLPGAAPRPMYLGWGLVVAVLALILALRMRRPATAPDTP